MSDEQSIDAAPETVEVEVPAEVQADAAHPVDEDPEDHIGDVEPDPWPAQTEAVSAEQE